MRINPQEQWPIDFMLLAIQADRLRDREDVIFIERPFEGRTPVSRRTEDDTLLWRMRIRMVLIILLCYKLYTSVVFFLAVENVG